MVLVKISLEFTEFDLEGFDLVDVLLVELLICSELVRFLLTHHPLRL